jgi:hypothetical protein
VVSKGDAGIADFTEVPVQTRASRLADITNAEDGGVDVGDCPKGDARSPGQFNCRSNAQDVEQENTNRQEKPDTKTGSALGVGGVDLRFGLVCGLFVHGRSLAQDKRFNRRKRRERRGFNRRALFRERAGSFWVPESPIPEIESFEGFGLPAQDVDWTVDGDKSWWKEAFTGQPLGRAAAEEVNEEKDRCPETPTREAEARGTGGLGFGLDLVRGLFVHGVSVAQKEGFNRRKVLADGHYEQRKESYGVSV